MNIGAQHTNNKIMMDFLIITLKEFLNSKHTSTLIPLQNQDSSIKIDDLGPTLFHISGDR